MNKKRQVFGKITEILEIPDLIAVQFKSWNDMLQKDVDPLKRENKGIEEVLNSTFPIEGFDDRYRLEYLYYELEEPKRDVLSCIRNGETYSSAFYVKLRLHNKVDDEIVDERVFFADLPVMTNRGTFIVNGAERVIVSQLHRSPGVCFESSVSLKGITCYSFRFIPDRGSWVEFQYDNNGLIYIYLDRKRRRRKFLISTFLRAIAFESNRELLDVIYGVQKNSLSFLKASANLEDFYTIDSIEDKDGDVIVHGLEGLNQSILDKLKEAKIKNIEFVDTSEYGNTFVLNLQKDTSVDQDDAYKTIYKKVRPTEPVSLTNAKQFIRRQFFDVGSYDLGSVGRYKINKKLHLDIADSKRVLTKEDFIAATKHLMRLHHENGQIDDIDHLGNRCVRSVGELVNNQIRSGLARTERIICERMTLIDTVAKAISPSKLVNPKNFQNILKDFFQRSQLSQFMDQTNPLSELTSKRRLSALGPGGLSRERAGFEVRDVHHTHYGRICPIETPEGANIGLISSLAIYARIDKYGFIETPYRKVKKGKVTNDIEFLSAEDEAHCTIAQANAKLEKTGRFSNQFVLSRTNGDSFDAKVNAISHIDVSPKQLVSPGTSCIPFLEHDDANRVLMGANMQRQAVPLMITDSPLVGTGMEGVVARHSRAVVISEITGVVASVTSDTIIITTDGKLPKKLEDLESNQIYNLYKFMRSNSGTNMNQKPIVKVGQKVKQGDVIADGFATQGGELALGKNVLVAFMSWRGYNFEDAIIISERLVSDDVYTSIHISESSILARETKLGPEEITRDTPNVGEEALRNLDAEGVIRVGSEVKPRDILVGKITPKSETELAPEEKLLKAIFGAKAADVRDSSLYAGSGVSGFVMDVTVERKLADNEIKDNEAYVKKEVKSVQLNYKNQCQEYEEQLIEDLSVELLGAKLHVDILSKKNGEVIVPANRKITKVLLKKLASKYSEYKPFANGFQYENLDKIILDYSRRIKDSELRMQERLKQLSSSESDGLGSIIGVKVYIANKRKIQIGDKMAGRHGNKGIIATIVPQEDLPFMEDGTPVDIILNPLGVPSRMNIGQILETHLGWAAQKLGIKVGTPVFDGISEEQIQDFLVQADLPTDGKTVLYDGRTGDRFNQRIMVGYIYMLKLDHLAVNKLHARAVGPYSLVTQQPLGGKAQHGGQRFGEMEVWALEAYGAAYTLQEMLTVKSDDVIGRIRIYESIVKGDNTLEAGTPQSFNVLMREIQSLCLDIRTKRV